MSFPSLDVVIVNWNTGDYLRECLASFPAARRNDFILERVIVVDNASSDGSACGLDRTGLPLTVLHNSKNKGFAAACNQGARESSADFLLFLNPDTRLAVDSIFRPLSFLMAPAGAGVGIVGIRLVDERGMTSRTCARFPTPVMIASAIIGLDRILPLLCRGYFMREWDHLGSRVVDHVIGAFYLVRRSVFESLSGFDERYFVYLEDLDFSFRAKRAGWDSYYCAQASAYHKGGGSSQQVKARRLFYALHSRILYGYKNFSRGSAALLLLGTLFVEPIPRMVWALCRRSLAEVKETLQAYALLWKSLLTGHQ